MNISEKLFNEAKNYLGDAKSYLGKEARHAKAKYCSCSGESTATIAAALLIGAAVGAALGVLFAPNKGSQTRSNISDSIKDLSYKASDKLKQGKEAFSNLKNKASEAEKSVNDTVASKTGKRTNPES